MAESTHLADQQEGASSFASFAKRRSDVIQQEEIEELLKLTSQEISKQTTASSTMLVELSNSTESQEKLKDLLPAYFYSWNLTNSHSIVVYLLLHFFLIKRENDSIINDKRLYEDHIARLKSRMSDLEERLTKSSLALATASGGGSVGNSSGRVQREESLSEVYRLRRQLEQLMRENEELKKTNKEICRINEQWALDYAQLSDQISNATGFYSNSSTGSHSQDTKSDCASPIPKPDSNSSTMCSSCIEKDVRIENNERELTRLECGMESLKCELQETKEKLRQREKMMERLESEHQAIILQLQEIGDLQQALRVKQEFRKLQHQYAQIRRQQQDTMCEKLHLQKQVEKLRQAFLDLFPFAQTHPPSTIDPAHNSTSGGYGYNSFPMRTCRRHYQQYPHSDPPPTPPGLIARGDHHGSLVEKDEDHTPLFPGHHKYAEQVTGFEKPSKSLGAYDLLQHSNKSAPIQSTFGHPSLNSSGHFLSTSSISRPVVPSQTSNTGYSSSLSLSMPNAASNGKDKGTASHPHTLPAPPSTLPLSTSHPHKSHTVTNLSMSSGYGSPSPFNHVTPSTENTGTTKLVKREDALSSSELSKTSQTGFPSQKPRPNELFESVGNHHGDVLYCSNCKKQFKYCRQSFDSWFEHIRFCDK